MFSNPERNPIFGLIRSGVMRETALIRPSIGSDECLLIPLALRRKFGEVSKPLLRSGWHSESYSIIVGQAERSGGVEGAVQAEWFDPANKRRTVLPRWRRHWEQFPSIVRSKENLGEKIVMMTYLCRIANWWRENLREELRIAISHVPRNTPMGVAARWLAAVIDKIFIVTMVITQTLFQSFLRVMGLLNQATK